MTPQTTPQKEMPIKYLNQLILQQTNELICSLQEQHMTQTEIVDALTSLQTNIKQQSKQMSSLSHDIRTPITTIKLSTYLLEEQRHQLPKTKHIELYTRTQNALTSLVCVAKNLELKCT